VSRFDVAHRCVRYGDACGVPAPARAGSRERDGVLAAVLRNQATDLKPNTVHRRLEHHADRGTGAAKHGARSRALGARARARRTL